MRNTTMKDPYKVLGIERNATEETIKKAFREKSKIYHPDTTTDETKKKELEEEFKQISAAYDTLSDPNKKASYDNPLSNGNNINDILNQFMGGMHGMHGFQFHFGGNQTNPNVFFEQNIQQRFDIDVFLLILGGEVNVALPDGTQKKINVPPNTPVNARFKLKVNDNVNVILVPNVIIPNLNESQLKKLREVFVSN